MPSTSNKRQKIQIFLVLLEKYIYIQHLVLKTSKEAMRQRPEHRQGANITQMF